MTVPAVLIKPVFTALAALMLITQTRLRGRFHRRILFAFILLVVGMLILEISIDTHPMYILLCFFVSQVYFVRAFYLDFSSAPELDKFGARVTIALGMLFSFTTYLFLRPHLGEYKIPALIYSFLMTMVMMMAGFRRLRVNQGSFILILCASCMFAATALIFAVNHLAGAANSRIGTDVAYTFAVYLMALGAAERKLVLLD